MRIFGSTTTKLFVEAARSIHNFFGRKCETIERAAEQRDNFTEAPGTSEISPGGSQTKGKRRTERRSEERKGP